MNDNVVNNNNNQDFKASDNCKHRINLINYNFETMQHGQEDLLHSTRYDSAFNSCRTKQDADNNTQSNESTPYYTPIDFMQSPFEFPTSNDNMEESCSTIYLTKNLNTVKENQHKIFSNETMDGYALMACNLSPRVLYTTNKSFNKHLDHTPSSINRKVRRYSMYERRSCSPQYTTKNASSVESSMETDKENTIPKTCVNWNTETKSGDNSPNIIMDDSNSPRILTNTELALLTGGRLAYSPKLLNSINNLNLTSPLNNIGSAGYKNGNYFKFPDIDQSTVQDLTQIQNTQNVGIIASQSIKQQSSSKKIIVPSSVGSTQMISHYVKSAMEKSNETNDSDKLLIDTPMETSIISINEMENSQQNHKNKNNLTIKIINNASMDTVPSSSSLHSDTSIPKISTIKFTKEKTISLDSTSKNNEVNNSVLGQSNVYITCDKIEPFRTSSNIIKQIEYPYERSTFPQNLQLSTLSSSSSSSLPIKSQMKNANKIIKHRLQMLNSANRQLFPYKEQLYFDTDSIIDKDENKSITIHNKDNEELKRERNILPSGSSHCTSSTSNRIPHKQNLLLHASSTNLKTLPELLTLVEFTAGYENPLKQRSMDFSYNKKNSKQYNISASTNLLQRRGSNHNLTLNLHESNNLIRNCGTGISVSNYNLGSVYKTSTSTSKKINSKSSFNLNASNTHNVNISNSNSNKTSTLKQNLLSRRGSNNNLTLKNLTASSGGHLNSTSFQHQEKKNSNAIPIKSFSNSSLITKTKRGLLERRGSNQNLIINTNSVNNHQSSDICGSYDIENYNIEGFEISNLQPLCNVHYNQRKFFSSESISGSNNYFSESIEKNEDKSVNFSSVSNLKVDPQFLHPFEYKEDNTNNRFSFQKSSICTCTGIRSIATKPLSPQTTSEEFKMYLANIQLLQNASNVLNQADLIKFNYAFDNSFIFQTCEQSLVQTNPTSTLNHETLDISDLKDFSSLVSISENDQIIKRYSEVVNDILISLKPNLDEQKQMFCNLHKEFWDLPLNHQEKPIVFGSQAKNRYKTILPNENSRVILNKQSEVYIELMQEHKDKDEVLLTTFREEVGNNEEVPYINANYIKGPDFTSKCFIATQGPLPNTIYDFWLMVYQNTKKYIFKSANNFDKSANAQLIKSLQQYYQKILMLTNFMENNRQKCAIYFPVEHNELLIITAKEELLKSSLLLEEYFDNYINNFIKTKQTTENAYDQKIHIVTDRVVVDPKFLLYLPSSGVSFFVLKNLGLVKKYGYSIRKLIVLYCINLTRSSGYLLISSFFCFHYWYPEWPDHRSPIDINTLLDISLHILNLGKCESEFLLQNENEKTDKILSNINKRHVKLYQHDLFNIVQPLLVVHCSAGIGRTGCMTAILNGIRQIRQSLAYSLVSMAKQITVGSTISAMDYCLPDHFLTQSTGDDFILLRNIDSNFIYNTLLYVYYIRNVELKTNSNEAISKNSCQLPSLAELSKMPNIFVDILGIVCNLRLQRGGMVQNSEQYELIHRALCLYLKRAFALKNF